MATWLMSANESVFNHALAFKEKGEIDWKQNRHYCVGDTVFIYCTKPSSRIRYMTKVITINQTLDDIDNDLRFWKKPELRTYSAKGKFFRIRMIAVSDDDGLIFAEIKDKKLLLYPPQSPQKLNDDLINYLMKFFKIGDERDDKETD